MLFQPGLCWQNVYRRTSGYRLLYSSHFILPNQNLLSFHCYSPSIMAYRNFHQCHPDFEGQLPIFHDTDGSPVYEAPYRILLQSTIVHNDTAALNSYNNSPHSRVFLQAYDGSYDNPFSIAFGYRSFDALRILIKMYLSDTSLTEPLEEYTRRLNVSFIHDACATADQELVLWLMNHDPPLES